MLCLNGKNGYGIAFLFLCIFGKESAAQNCKIDAPPPSDYIDLQATESLIVGEIVTNYSTIDIASINLKEPNDYLIITFNLETNTIDFVIAKSLTESLDAGINRITLSMVITCSDNSKKEALVSITILDENNKIPEFSSTEYAISIQNPWPIWIPINCPVPISVEDADFDIGNADVKFETSEPTLFKVVGTRTSDISPYVYSVHIELLAQIDANINFEIRAMDGVNTGTALISLTVSRAHAKLIQKKSNI